MSKEYRKAVKDAIGITGTYQDDMIDGYVTEIVSYLEDAGIKEENISNGIVARGASDLWFEKKLSNYFMQRAVQLAYKEGEKDK